MRATSYFYLNRNYKENDDVRTRLFKLTIKKTRHCLVVKYKKVSTGHRLIYSTEAES